MLKKILIVDDESDIVELLEARLDSNQYSVSSARSGKEALKKAGEARPDLIIMDIMMPDIYGNDVARILGQDKSTKDIPIIFLTALQTKKEQKEWGPEIGEHTIFAKPFETQELLAKIKQLIG